MSKHATSRANSKIANLSTKILGLQNSNTDNCIKDIIHILQDLNNEIKDIKQELQSKN